MKKRLWSVFAVAVVLSLFAAACAPSAAPTKAPVEEKTKAAVLFPGVVTDDSWNEEGYLGLLQAEDECNVEGAYTENVSQDEQIEVMRTYAAEGYDIIIGHGGEFVDAAETVAAEYPDIQFVITNGYVGHDNVSSIRTSYAHMGYLAGVLAAEMSKTNKIAAVSAEPIKSMETGIEQFRAGAASVGKGTEVSAVYTGNWVDVSLAQEASLALIDDGVDVLFHLLDAADAGLYNAAEDRGVMSIGSERDGSHLAPTSYLGSTMSSTKMLVYMPACGQVAPGEVATEDVTNYVYFDMSDRVPEEIKQKVLDIEEKMKSGEIYVEP